MGYRNGDAVQGSHASGKGPIYERQLGDNLQRPLLPLLPEHTLQPLLPKALFLGSPGLSYAVGMEQDEVARLEVHRTLLVRGICEHTQRHADGRQQSKDIIARTPYVRNRR